jgi:hypothetical protein
MATKQTQSCKDWRRSEERLGQYAIRKLCPLRKPTAGAFLGMNDGSSTIEAIHCEFCDAPLSEARLKARPTATACVGCLEANGDVDRIKRHDEYLGKEGEDQVSTYFIKPNQYLEKTIGRDIGFRIGRISESYGNN